MVGCQALSVCLGLPQQCVTAAVCAARDAGTAPTFSTEARLEGRTVLVTGANTGLGRETALDCARRGARLILACRDMTKCEEVRRTRGSETGAGTSG